MDNSLDYHLLLEASRANLTTRHDWIWLAMDVTTTLNTKIAPVTKSFQPFQGKSQVFCAMFLEHNAVPHVNQALNLPP